MNARIIKSYLCSPHRKEEDHKLLGRIFRKENVIASFRVHIEPGKPEKPEKPRKPGKPGKQAIFVESQGKPAIIREICIIFIQVREKSGKADHLVNILFS